MSKEELADLLRQSKIQEKIVHLLSVSKTVSLDYNEIVQLMPEYKHEEVVEGIKSLIGDGQLDLLLFIEYDFMDKDNLYPGKACSLKSKSGDSIVIEE